MDGVVLPGPGGMINSSNSQSGSPQSRKKWGQGTNAEGFMTIGKGSSDRLDDHAKRRAKAVSMITDRNEYADGATAMSEIVGRKSLRAAQYREIKSKEYNFAEETGNEEFLAMGSYKECSCEGCASCRDKKRKDAEFREYTGKMRDKISSGAVEGEFAGPDQSFPISSAADVKAAFASVGRAKNPRAVMKKIISIAKKMNLESSLPDSVKERMANGESGLPG